jgi:hypothetical protein
MTDETMNNECKIKCHAANIPIYQALDYLYYLAKQELDIYIRVHSFNVEHDVDIENIKITPTPILIADEK